MKHLEDIFLKLDADVNGGEIGEKIREAVQRAYAEYREKGGSPDPNSAEALILRQLLQHALSNTYAQTLLECSFQELSWRRPGK